MDSSLHQKTTNDSALRARMYGYGRRSNYMRRPTPEAHSLVLDIRSPAAQRTQSVASQPRAVVRHNIVHSSTLRPSVAAKAPHLLINDIKPARKHRSAKPAHAVHSPDARHAVRHKATSRQMPSNVLKRETVRPMLPRQSYIRLLMRRLPKDKLLLLGGILVIAGGLGLGWNSFRTNQKVDKTVQKIEQHAGVVNGASTDSDTPSENNPEPPSSYRTAPDLPRVIRIEKIGVEARVVRLGIKRDNQLAAPGNIFDAGWYDDSSKPGEGGAMLLDGHVSGPTKHGVFYDLKKLVPGDTVSVERGDGKVVQYKVKKVAAYENDKVDMAAALVPVTPGKNGLNLITCNGDIDSSGTHFKQRLMVFTEQI